MLNDIRYTFRALWRNACGVWKMRAQSEATTPKSTRTVRDSV